MESFKNFPSIVLLAFAIAITSTVIVMPVNGQSSMICTGAMMRSFSPCISYLTSGSNSSSSPTSNCCNSLKDLMSNGQDCLCLIVTGGSALQVPINRTLAMSLPRACNMSGVPIEYKATSSPVPAPVPGGPGPGGSNTSPGSFPSPPRGPFTPPSSTPGGDTTTPEAPEGDIVPTLTPPGMRPVLTPSAAAQTSHMSVFPSLLLVAVLGAFLSDFF
ncbi:hypothetical protein RD792_010036 [Penstemon davidsonii]|uniref:Bifunctional inhibitor/plant lipid transfer protein/seed storage helical domain-containing protein n=1 Tax=Penstemon davidsonii TaxID=160366 RepID=A0ABR0D243_9LAMI|nr:hypothetical protein RD792_010036 [Penstemon davidsonii]